MASYVYKTAPNCNSCGKTSTTTKRKYHLQLFPSKRPLELVAIHILGFLSKTTKGSQHVVIFTYRYSKLTRAVVTARNTTTAVECIFFETWVITYGIPAFLHTCNGTQFANKFFGTFHTHLGTKHMTSTLFQPQPNTLVEGYNKTCITHQRQYIPTHQRA